MTDSADTIVTKQSNLVVATKEEVCEEKIAPTKKFKTATVQSLADI